MRVICALLVLVSLSLGEWIETTIQLPDSMSGLHGIGSLVFHEPNHTIYVGGDGRLIAVDALTYQKLASITLPGTANLMCTCPALNKAYCASVSGQSVWVIDCATNRLLTTIPLDSEPEGMCCAEAAGKVYVACPRANAVDVIDCGADSVVARIPLQSPPWALCYNPGQNRVYAVLSPSDEVAVIDCTTDAVIHTIWVRGVWPTDICYDSLTNCVYTANRTSGTSSVIDCSGDSLVRLVAVGDEPDKVVTGLHGKVYCGAFYDTMVTVIESGGMVTVPLGDGLTDISSDRANDKVYCATSDSEVVVIDASGDTVLVRVRAGENLGPLCYDPARNNTWVANWRRATVSMIDGVTNGLSDTLRFGRMHPGALRYGPLNNHLYCLAKDNDGEGSLLLIVDGNTNQLLKILPTGNSGDSTIWNHVNNKLYFPNLGDRTVSVLDCTNDSLVGRIGTPRDCGNAMCYSDDGKVYIASVGEVVVVDPGGDTVRGVVPISGGPLSLCYDRTDDKVYVGAWDCDSVSVIDVKTDSVVAYVPLPIGLPEVSWNQNHDNVYVSSAYDNRVVVIDCTSDTVQRVMASWDGLNRGYSDSLSDKVYFADVDGVNLRIVDASNYTFYRTVHVGAVGAMTDNGRPGSNHRVYSSGWAANQVAVVSGTTDSILRSIQVGEGPLGLAWNPVHSWVYASNYGSSSITVIRDSVPVGLEEGCPQATNHKCQVTMVNGVLELRVEGGQQTGNRAELLDVGGRKALDLKPGANDVRMLAPGVYFVREKPQEVCKVVIAR